MFKSSPLKQFDKFEVLSGVSEEVEKREKEKEEQKREKEEEIKTVAEEQKRKEEEEKKQEEEKKIQEDTAKYQNRIDAGEITIDSFLDWAATITNDSQADEVATAFGGIFDVVGDEWTQPAAPPPPER